MEGCSHRFFHCETVGVEAEGKVVVIALCTACGDVISKEVQVARPHTQLRLLNEEKRKKEQ